MNLMNFECTMNLVNFMNLNWHAAARDVASEHDLQVGIMG